MTTRPKSGAKLLLFSHIRKYFGKKMQKIVIFLAKHDVFVDFTVHRFTNSPIPYIISTAASAP